MQTESQAFAYIKVFESIYSGSDLQSKYIALDLTKIKYTNHPRIKELFKAYCASNNHEFLDYSYDELVKRGYINKEYMYFDNGVIVSFNDISLTPEELRTGASLWKSGLASTGGVYTATKSGTGNWKIKGFNSWISFTDLNTFVTIT